MNDLAEQRPGWLGSGNDVGVSVMSECRRSGEPARTGDTPKPIWAAFAQANLDRDADQRSLLMDRSLAVTICNQRCAFANRVVSSRSGRVQQG